jgi:hypothetical protein
MFGWVSLPPSFAAALEVDSAHRVPHMDAAEGGEGRDGYVDQE